MRPWWLQSSECWNRRFKAPLERIFEVEFYCLNYHFLIIQQDCDRIKMFQIHREVGSLRVWNMSPWGNSPKSCLTNFPRGNAHSTLESVGTMSGHVNAHKCLCRQSWQFCRLKKTCTVLLLDCKRGSNGEFRHGSQPHNTSHRDSAYQTHCETSFPRSVCKLCDYVTKIGKMAMFATTINWGSAFL